MPPYISQGKSNFSTDKTITPIYTKKYLPPLNVVKGGKSKSCVHPNGTSVNKHTKKTTIFALIAVLLKNASLTEFYLLPCKQLKNQFCVAYIIVMFLFVEASILKMKQINLCKTR